MGAAEERAIHKIQTMLVCAIASGTSLTWTYGFIKPATARDLAAIEKAITGWVRTTLRQVFKLKPKEIPKFYLDLSKGKFVDDGDNTVTITLDFGKLLPGERPPETLRLARELMDRYREPGEEPAP